MTDAERPPDADSDRTQDDARATLRPSPDADAGHAAGATFRSDGGPGSVMRERQPGFGGMDAREAVEGEPAWQAVTSDRYGHRVGPVESEAGEVVRDTEQGATEQETTDHREVDPSGEPEANDAPDGPPARR